MKAKKQAKITYFATLTLCVIALGLYVAMHFSAQYRISVWASELGYSAPAWLLTLQRLIPLYICMALTLAGGLVARRSASAVLLSVGLLFAIVQFFAIKITNVAPYFVTYRAEELLGLYFGTAALIGALIIKLKSRRDFNINGN